VECLGARIPFPQFRKLDEEHKSIDEDKYGDSGDKRETQTFGVGGNDYLKKHQFQYSADVEVGGVKGAEQDSSVARQVRDTLCSSPLVPTKRRRDITGQG